jgi:gamma-glutamylcyclotransferase (GGCT)/AIG2-like uncharacterized protein YtfP
MSESTLLFVYGSLMNGMEADDLLRRMGARLIGRAAIQGKLVDLGEFPGVVKSSNPKDVVFGELYEVPENQAFHELDEYEEFTPSDPRRSLFIRELTLTRLVDDAHEPVEAWVYFYNPQADSSPGRRIRSGDYRSYQRRTAAHR